MKWMTISPCTRTITNSHFVKRQTISQKTCKDLYGKNLTIMKQRVLCAQEPLDELPEIRDSQEKDLKPWLDDGEKNGVNLLDEHMNTLALEQVCFEDYERSEYDSYSIILYKLLLDELNYQRRSLKYSTIFGDKWRKIHGIKRNLLTTQIRIHECENNCKDFIKKERAFKKKYFQDENYIIKGIDIE